MTLLLDTQALLLWHKKNGGLGAGARQAIDSASERPRVSVASLWEAAIKYAAGRLNLPKPPNELLSDSGLEAHGFRVLEIRGAHALAAGALPRHHGDPFDRLLIAQAQLEDLTIVTTDVAFGDYDVRVLDARS